MTKHWICEVECNGCEQRVKTSGCSPAKWRTIVKTNLCTHTNGMAKDEVHFCDKTECQEKCQEYLETEIGVRVLNPV